MVLLEVGGAPLLRCSAGLVTCLVGGIKSSNNYSFLEIALSLSHVRSVKTWDSGVVSRAFE